MRDAIKKRKQYAVLSVLLCLVAVFGIMQYSRAQKLSYEREVEYNRVFSELTEYVDDIEISLLKGQLVTDPVRTAYFSSELSRQASGAKANLALLPENSTKLEKTAKFLSQVGDYASYISQKSLRGEEITAEETENIKKLTSYAHELKAALDSMLLDINDGKLSFSDEKSRLAKLSQGSRSALAKDFDEMEEEFHNYPSLIYDGPFSQHLTDKKSVFTDGKPEIDKNAALKLSEKFLKGKKKTVEEIGGKLPAYSISDGISTVEFTKRGGTLLLLMHDCSPSEEKLSVDDAKKKAAEFLAQNGFFDMRESYYENKNGSVVINYAYSQDGYIVYPDLVKVKVSLDDGKVVGFESRGYIMNHCYRDIPEETLTREDALSKISKSLKTDTVSLAVIPLDSGKEAFCYQIRGTVSDKHFLVFVNTQTGDVEDMQILLEAPGGVLAV